MVKKVKVVDRRGNAVVWGTASAQVSKKSRAACACTGKGNVEDLQGEDLHVEGRAHPSYRRPKEVTAAFSEEKEGRHHFTEKGEKEHQSTDKGISARNEKNSVPVL